MSDILIIYMYLNFVGYDFNVDNFKVNFDSILYRFIFCI